MWYSEDVAPDYQFRFLLLRGILRFVPAVLRVVEDDWDATMVFIALYLDTLEQIARHEPQNAQEVSDLAQDLRMPSIRALEELLRIPRSTIHRKLGYLRDRGILSIADRRYSWTRDDDGLLRATKAFLVPTLEIERLQAEIAQHFGVPVKRGPSGIATTRPR